MTITIMQALGAEFLTNVQWRRFSSFETRFALIIIKLATSTVTNMAHGAHGSLINMMSWQST